MGTLSDRQFAGVVNENSGGSRLVHSGDLLPIGTPRTYMVGQPGHEARLPRPVGAEDLAAHRSAMLADPTVARDASAAQGLWQAKGGAFTVADHARAVHDRRTAVVEGRANREDAIFALGPGHDISLARTRPAPSMGTDDAGRPQVTAYGGNRRLGFDEVSWAPSTKRPAPKAPAVRTPPRVAGQRRVRVA